MAQTPLLPQPFWFRVAAPCPRLDGIPTAKGTLDLPPACRLPDLAPLDGRESWAEVRAAWNPRGLAVAVAVTGRELPTRPDPDGVDLRDGVQLWVDTRDVRHVHRATKFCHRFQATITPGRGGEPAVAIARRPIARAQAEPPASRAEIPVRVDRRRGGYRLEVFLPAEALHGFDPETNRRLGFAYQVTDPARGDAFLGVGREFPIGEDPSLWATLELRD